MANQKIDVVGDKDQRVAYCGAGGEKIAVCDKGTEPATVPVGTVYVQEATTVTNALVDGKPASGYLVVEGSKTFLRGRVVTDQKEATALLMPPFVKKLLSGLQGLGLGEIETVVEGTPPTVVVLIQSDGSEVGILLGDKDTAPPDGASPYPVGESPEEVAEVDAKAKAEREKGVAELAEFSLTETDYDDGYRVGNCPNCLQRHPLGACTIGLTDEEVEAERQRRGAAQAEDLDEDFDDLDDEDREVPEAELVEDEIGGESGRS